MGDQKDKNNPETNPTVDLRVPGSERDANAESERYEKTLAIDESEAPSVRTSSRRSTLSELSFRSLGDDDYELVREIGQGGMGLVSAGIDRRLGREIAIKRLRKGNAAHEARFVREALITARLQHPSIVPIYEVGRWSDGALVYTMRRYEGRTLHECLDKQPLATRLEHLRSIQIAAEAVAYAHKVQIIHRDLKPDNIIVGEFGETVVIDWGLAKEVGEADSPLADADELGGELTVFGSKLGTPRYMSPEQARGDEVDGKTDVYALGACLYHLLGGVPPFAEFSSDEVPLGTLPQPLGELEPAAPRELIAICRVAMSLEADQRPSAAEFASELGKFQAGALVGSHNYSGRELVRRWVAKHKLATTISAISMVLLGLLVVRVLVEANRTRAALHEVVQEKDSQILANAQVMSSADPTRALAMVSRLSSDPAAWRSARATLGMIQRNGIPTIIAQLPPDEVAELVRSGDIFIASGPKDAWVIDPNAGLVRHQALPKDAQRISTRHWLHWRAKELFALDVVTGEEKLARSFDTPPEKVSASSDGRVVAAIDAKELRVWVAGELVATRSDVNFATVSPDGTHLLASEGPYTTPSISYVGLADLKVERDLNPTWPILAHHISDNNDVILTMSNGVQSGWPIAGGTAVARCADTPRLVLRGSESGCVYRGTAAFARSAFGAIFGIVDMDVAVDRPIATAASSLGRAQVWNYRSDIGYSLVHSTGVLATAMDKGGLRAFTLSADGKIRRWDVSEADSQTLDHAVHTPEVPTVEVVLLPLGIVLGEEPTVVFAEQLEGGKSSGPLLTLRAQRLDSEESRLLQRVEGEISAIRGGPDALFAVAHAGPSGSPESVVAVYSLNDDGSAELVYRSALPSEVSDLEFCKDAAELVVGTRLGAVYRVGKSGATQIAKREGAVTAVAGTSSRVIAAWSDVPGIVLIDSASPGQETSWTSAHEQIVIDLDISRNGRQVVSASRSSALLLWNDGEAKILARIAVNPLALRLSSDERAVFVSTGSLASIVDLETGTSRELDLHPGAVRSIPGSGQYAVVDTRSFMLRVDDSLPYDPGLLRKWVEERLLFSGHHADEP